MCQFRKNWARPQSRMADTVLALIAAFFSDSFLGAGITMLLGLLFFSVGGITVAGNVFHCLKVVFLKS